MFTAKDIEIKVIDSSTARKMMRLFHYSGKSPSNCQVNFGVFLNNTIQGALQFGPGIAKRNTARGLNIGLNDSIELSRMALSDKCPKNSESRALGICLRILQKQYPHLKVVLSFADACQCGDGTIYRASGFKLLNIKKNTSMFVNSDGEVVCKKTFNNIVDQKTGKRFRPTDKYKPLPGFQMKYLYFFDKELEKKFKFVDFKDIPKEVRMYKGEKSPERAESIESSAGSFQESGGGESPTSALHSLQGGENV